ncbi:MAG: hypothetical protein Q9171_005444 [Xanthocarpia ochracea]
MSTPPHDRNPTRLIIVCCHAIWLGGPSNGHDDAEWAIEPFQRGETPTIIEHIKAGLKELSEEPDSALAAANTYFAFPICPSTVTHDLHSTDSYQNLIFSLLRFRSLYQHYPTYITLVSYDFKRSRFLDLHVPAISWPLQRVRFVGIDPPESVSPRKGLENGERLRGYGVWKGDLYGAGEILREKRVGRGWREESV